MQRVIVVCPRTPGAGLLRRMLEAAYQARCIRDSMERGEAPIAALVLGRDPVSRAYSRMVERQWLRSATHIAVYTDHGVPLEMVARMAGAPAGAVMRRSLREA